MATQGSDARYAHLLEPIRDLAQNWSIDIASELEEYLGELESITISFDDGTTLNFAEAALLIQGSTCIYSKKVEHLYTLVYQVLNQVVEQKRVARQAASIAEDGTDRDVVEMAAEDAWLTLDDTLQEVANISLAPTRGAPDTSAFTLSRTPFLGGGPSSSGAGGESEYKMHSCVVHASGALLLPNVYLPPHVLAALSPADRAGFTPNARSAAGAAAAFGGGSEEGGDDGTVAMRDEDDDDTWQPADDGGGGWEEPAEGWAGGDATEATLLLEERAETSEHAPPASDSAQAARGEAGGARCGARPAACGASPTSVTWDPWAPLDPHEAPPKGSLRPFRKGRTHSASDAATAAAEAEASWLAAADEAAASPEDEKENEGASATSEPSDLLSWLRLLPRGAQAGVVPLKRPLWEQFDALHALEAKRRAAARRQRRQLVAERGHLSSHAEADEVEVEADAMAAAGTGAADEAAADATLAGDAYGDDDDDVAPLGFDDDDDDEHADCEHADGGAAESALVARGGAAPSAASLAASSYEEICREHVESCLQAGTSYAEDLELLRRVSEWQARVEPALQEQEARGAFDVAEYSRRLLSNFDASERGAEAASKRPKGAAEEIVSFAQLAQSEDTYEVCRMFLAALQLSNTGNVEILAEGELDSPNASGAGGLSLSLKLLSRDAAFSLAALE